MSFFDTLYNRWVKKQKNIPVFWKGYMDLIRSEKFKRNTPLRDYQYVIFDTETTGLNIQKDRICQIGAVRVQDNNILIKDVFDRMVQQESSGEAAAKVIHGLRDKSLVGGYAEKQALEEFIGYIGSSILVAHHARFDIGMINMSLKRHYGSRYTLKNKVLDTATLEKRLVSPVSHHYASQDDYTLDTLSNKYSIALYDRHTAIGDAYITAQLFLKQLIRLEKRGVKRIGDLLK